MNQKIEISIVAFFLRALNYNLERPFVNPLFEPKKNHIPYLSYLKPPLIQGLNMSFWGTMII